MEKENENKIENEIEDDSQDKILESLTAKDYYNIILPKDDFFDIPSDSSSSENDEYEKYTAYYLRETVLEDPKNIKYIKEVDINKLTAYDRTLAWFDDNLFNILLKFCKKETKNIIFHPDYIINNIEGQNLKERIKKYNKDVIYFEDWIKNDKKYDLMGEVSLSHLTTSKDRILLQIKKYIKFFRLFEEIEECKNIKTEIKKEFEENLGLINGNEKILVLKFAGNNEDYLNYLKQSKIVINDKNNEIDDGGLTPLQTIFKELKTSGVHFITIYIWRDHVKNRPANPQDEALEKIRKDLDVIKEQINEIRLGIMELEKKNK